MRCWLTRKHSAPPTSPVPPPPPANLHSLSRADLLWLCVAGLSIVVLLAAPMVYFACVALHQWGTAGTEASKTFETLNRNCDGGKEACGTLADVNQTLHTIRSTFGQIETAAKHEDSQLGTLDKQERTLFNDLHGIAGDARKALSGVTDLTKVTTGAIQTTQTTIGDAQAPLASLKAFLDTSDALAKSAQKRIDDKHIDILMQHLDGTVTHLDGATGDVQTVFDRVAKPTPCKGRWCWVIKTGQIISAAHDVPEFGYWTDQLITSLRSH